jgi:hypothetical protein
MRSEKKLKVDENVLSFLIASARRGIFNDGKRKMKFALSFLALVFAFKDHANVMQFVSIFRCNFFTSK